MKRIAVLLILLQSILLTHGNCQSSIQVEDTAGVKFTKLETWPDILQKAKQEHKYIFVDCYTTWCGPCKYMSSHVFTQKDVGDFVNQNFISVAIQMDRTEKDMPDIKKRYAEAKALKDSFSISEYPTYLFFSSEGSIVHKFVGATQGDKFISKAKDALDSNKQYYKTVAHYRNHMGDSSYLNKALLRAIAITDLDNADAIADAYLNSVLDPFNPNNLRALGSIYPAVNDTVFRLFYNHTGLIDTILHIDGYAERRVSYSIYKAKIAPLFQVGTPTVYWKQELSELNTIFPNLSARTTTLITQQFEDGIVDREIRSVWYGTNMPLADWHQIAKQIQKRYPDFDLKMRIASEKYQYYGSRKMWPECEAALIKFLDKYGNEISSSEASNIAWNYVFLHSYNYILLRKTAEICKKILVTPDSKAYPLNTTFEDFDTYANILYKLGNQTEAIAWEKKALDLSISFGATAKDDQQNYKITLERMQNGESTVEGRNKRGNYE